MKTCCVLCSDLQADGLHWLLSVCGWDPMSVRPPGPDPISHQRQRSVGQETKSKCRVQFLRYPASSRKWRQTLNTFSANHCRFCVTLQLQLRNTAGVSSCSQNIMWRKFIQIQIKFLTDLVTEDQNYIFINIVSEELHEPIFQIFTWFYKTTDFYCFIPLKTAETDASIIIPFTIKARDRTSYTGKL